MCRNGGQALWLETKPASVKKTMTTTLSSWNPLRELEEFQNRILGAFRPAGDARPQDTEGRSAQSVAAWMPLVDISEDEDSYLIAAEVPEVRKEDVKVTLENGVLGIRGERRFEKAESSGRTYHRVERSYGYFARTFNLPSDADTGKVEASFNEGILEIRVPKSEAAKPKEIEVKVK